MPSDVAVAPLPRARLRALGVAGLLAACAAPPVAAPAPATVERMWILDGGSHRTNDLSRWTPGSNVGRPWEFANHCYLIRHARGLLLWDTGHADAIAALPDGLELGGGAVRVRRTTTLRGQLAALGFAPEAVTHLALSHFHRDHAGNANLFGAATLLVQATEQDAAFGATPERFGFDPQGYDQLRGRPVVRLHGDHDVFGDGAVVILATPGHTPGHQSLLVRLPQRGPVLLAGDLAHLRANWDARQVPTGTFDPVAARASMVRIADLATTLGAPVLLAHEPAGAAWPLCPASIQ